MVNRDRADSKKHLWRAFLLLCTGSFLLLCTKLPVPPVVDTLLCFGGGAVLLYANGEFLFGLLIHANMDESPPQESQHMGPSSRAASPTEALDPPPQSLVPPLVSPGKQD